MINLVLFGPPGAGKGTQSENLIAHYKLLHLSTGDLLRSEIASHTELGIKAKQFIDEGKLVPDEVVIGMIEAKLKEAQNKNGIIFDGFPRTTNQAVALDEMLTRLGTSITKMVSLEVSQDELMKRLLLRGQTSGRTDDNEETIQKRIAEYESKTRPVADYYKAQNKLVSVEGVGSVEEIFERIRTQIDK